VEECVQEISTIFSKASMVADSRAVLLKYTEEYCPKLDINVPNGALPAVCFHSGYYLLQNLYPLALSTLTLPQENYTVFVHDFCTQYG
jgi:hypothetical protein